jgi:hypothetical protein
MEYPLFYKKAMKACPNARYVGGTSKHLCECQDPKTCNGVALQQKRQSQVDALIDAGIKYCRAEYMAKEVSHADYYGQFGAKCVTSIASQIGEMRLKRSTDEYLNDIPLERWDCVHISSDIMRLVSHSNASCAQGYEAGYSLSDKVCIAKAAARLWKESNQ